MVRYLAPISSKLLLLTSQSSTPTHWKLICVPAETIDLQRLTEESNSRICIVQECDDNGKAFEVAVDPSYLSEVQELQSQENPPYNPTHPREVEKDILGICQANRKARERWLQRAVDVIFSEHRHEIKEAYRNLTQLLGLQRELDRKILIQDISVSDRPQSSDRSLMYLTGLSGFRPPKIGKKSCILVSESRSRPYVCRCPNFPRKQRGGAN
jgi:hypothetical protein